MHTFYREINLQDIVTNNHRGNEFYKQEAFVQILSYVVLAYVYVIW